MLEVHAPHTRIRAWKDFFVHIVTITIGLLIAIGLEQTVEHFHRLSQLQSVRRELAIEMEENRKIAEKDRQQMRAIAVDLSRDLALLRASQISHKPIAGQFNYSWLLVRPRTGAWEVAKQSGALGLMPHGELQAYAHLYDIYPSFMSEIGELSDRIDSANAIAQRSPNGTLLPHDIEELVTATSEAQAALSDADKILNFEDRAMDDVKPRVVMQ